MGSVTHVLKSYVGAIQPRVVGTPQRHMLLHQSLLRLHFTNRITRLTGIWLRHIGHPYTRGTALKYTVFVYSRTHYIISLQVMPKPSQQRSLADSWGLKRKRADQTQETESAHPTSGDERASESNAARKKRKIIDSDREEDDQGKLGEPAEADGMDEQSDEHEGDDASLE